MTGPNQRQTSGDESGDASTGVAGGAGLAAALPAPPPETTELGIDIIRVQRIRDSLARFGDRFTKRVLTPTEQAYVRGRPATMAGRWAAANVRLLCGRE